MRFSSEVMGTEDGGETGGGTTINLQMDVSRCIVSAVVGSIDLSLNFSLFSSFLFEERHGLCVPCKDAKLGELLT